jgi:hypothetical protein
MTDQSSDSGYKFTIKSFSMREVYGARDQVRPVFETHASGNTIKAISEICNNTEGLRNASSASDMAEIIRPAIAKLEPAALDYAGTMAEPRAIPGGWDAERVTFTLSAIVANPPGMMIEVVIAGYTDKLPSKNGSEFDWKDVTFHINSITKLRSMTMLTSDGDKVVRDVIDASHVLRDAFYTGLHTGIKEYRIRPADVFATMVIPVILEENPNVIDARTVLTDKPVLSSRTNEIPAAFLSRMLANYKASMYVMDRPESTERDVLMEARQYSMEAATSNDRFLRAIAGDGALSTFTMANLQSVYPEIAGKCFYIGFNDRPTGAVLSTKHLPEHLKKELAMLQPGTLQDKAAIIVGHGVTALMASLGFSRVIFSASNDTPDGKLEVQVSHADSILDGSRSNPDGFAVFKSWLVSEVLSQLNQRSESAFSILTQLSYDSSVGFTIEVDANLYGETEVRLLQDDGRWYSRTIASYADALLSPMVMPAIDGVKPADQPHLVMARDIGTMLEAVVSPLS